MCIIELTKSGVQATKEGIRREYSGYYNAAVLWLKELHEPSVRRIAHPTKRNAKPDTCRK